MIRQYGTAFVLDTANTTYAFRVTDIGYLEHLYYGRKVRLVDGAGVLTGAVTEKHDFAPGNNNVYNEVTPYTLNDMRLEFSANGKGDNREPFIEVIHADGSRTSDFVYERAVIVDKKKPLDTLPSSYCGKDDCSGLIVTLVDRSYDLAVELSYYVFEDTDVITRSAKLINNGKDDVKILRFMSVQIDTNMTDMIFTTFNGAWAREMERCDHELRRGKVINDSCIGESSATANPFVMFSHNNTDENTGTVYAFNLVYSGNHTEIAEINEFGKLRFLSGINPKGFCYILEPGETFESPEAIMTVSNEGCNGMSYNMHRFIENHIMRGKWAGAERPVLLNSWEAAYFDIDETKLVDMAKCAADVGIELFVMDDGWFGNRNDDTSSLGDWYADTGKLPDGVRGLSDKIHALGRKFGIWVEPEMINEDSELYRKHPDWTLRIPGKPHSTGRNQMVIDLVNPEVREYLTGVLSKLFEEGNIDYVKWDMNRSMSDVFSPYLPAESMGECAHRYIMGFYEVIGKLTEKFPDILFEGCASGGNRFDPGMLCYFPQIWGSDDTDAYERLRIQTGYSYGYPLRCVGGHVSDVPNHQTLRQTPLNTRFNIAAFSAFGYECNFLKLPEDTLDIIKEQIRLYKEWRSVIQTGRFYRGVNIYDGNTATWNVVSKDRTRAVAMLFQSLVSPNNKGDCIKVHGLEENTLYHFYNNPVKIEIPGFFAKCDGETEDTDIYGDALHEAGVMLSQKFSSMGFADNTRVFGDFATRMYLIEKK